MGVQNRLMRQDIEGRANANIQRAMSDDSRGGITPVDTSLMTKR